MSQASNIKNTSHLKPMLFGCWVSTMIVAAFFLSNEDKYFSMSGVPIASISQAKKDVTVRSEDDVRWRLAKTNQDLFDGDKISTGPDSSATVNFGGGKNGVLGPDTIISVNSINQKDGKSFIVNLVKGGIKPIVPAGSKSQLIVTSGVNTFYVEAGESKGFSKPVGGVIREFKAKEKFPVIAKSAASNTPKYLLPAALIDIVAKLPTVAVEKVPVVEEETKVMEIAPSPSPKPTPSAKPLPSAKPKPTPEPRVDYLPLIPTYDANAIKSVLYTNETLSSIEGKVFDVEIQVKTSPLVIQAGIEVEIAGKKELIEAKGTGKVDISLLKDSVLKSKSIGAIPCAELKLRAYIKYNEQKVAKTKYGTSEKQVSICSVLDAKQSLPLVLGLSNLDTDGNKTLYFSPSSSVANFRYQVLVTRSEDFMKFLPYIRNSSAFKVIKASNGMTASGIYGVHRGQAVIQFVGKDFTPKLLDSWMENLGLAYIFKGPKNSVFDASSMDLPAFQEWLNQTGGAGVYIPVNGNLVLVSPGFAAERPEVASFVQKASKTIFRSRVDIISFAEK